MHETYHSGNLLMGSVHDCMCVGDVCMECVSGVCVYGAYALELGVYV